MSRYVGYLFVCILWLFVPMGAWAVSKDKNPILIIVYFATMIAVSWQLTVFTLLVVPAMGWVMGTVGKKLKRKSLEAQSKWSDTMS